MEGCGSSSGGCGGQGDCKNEQPIARLDVSNPRVCYRCGLPAKVQVHIKQGLCWECAASSITLKVKGALRMRGALQWNDRVLVALSGGPSSWVALHSLLSLHAPDDNRPGKHKFPFVLGVVHIEDTSQPAAHTATTSNSIRAWMTTHAPHIPLYILPLHALFADMVNADVAHNAGLHDGQHTKEQHDGQQTNEQQQHSSRPSSMQQHDAQPTTTTTTDAQGTTTQPGTIHRAQLHALLQSITDVTGREDLVHALHHKLLLKTAQAYGYAKLIMGDTQTTAAVRVVAAACKGQGYVLPTLVTGYDARLPNITVMHPMQCVTSKEAALLARHLHLPTHGPPHMPTHARRSINQLAEGFVVGLQQAMPSATHTITKTAGKLQGFAWSDVPAKTAAANSTTTTTTTTVSPATTTATTHLCAICHAPLHFTEIGHVDHNGAVNTDANPIDHNGAVNTYANPVDHNSAVNTDANPTHMALHGDANPTHPPHPPHSTSPPHVPHGPSVCRCCVLGLFAEHAGGDDGQLGHLQQKLRQLVLEKNAIWSSDTMYSSYAIHDDGEHDGVGGDEGDGVPLVLRDPDVLRRQVEAYLL